MLSCCDRAHRPVARSTDTTNIINTTIPSMSHKHENVTWPDRVQLPNHCENDITCPLSRRFTFTLSHLDSTTNMTLNFANLTVVVTGAGGGLGKT